MKQLYLFCAFAASLWAQAPTINEVPSREFGQLKLQPLASAPSSSAPNLVEGRELNSPYSIAFDTLSSPPVLYVADTFNNRVLAWQNPALLTRGNFANLAVGQRDLLSTQPKGPTTTLSTGLTLPTGLAVDPAGSLYVMDAGNNRIVRYPSPMRQTGDVLQVDLVIGQRTVSSGGSANQGLALPSNKTLYLSQGSSFFVGALVFDAQGNLWVTDSGNNRVLRFPASSLLANTLEPAADVVLGQPNFTTGTLPTDLGTTPRLNKSVLSQPEGLAFDQLGRLYVTDSFARALYFPTQATGVSATRVLGIPPTPDRGQPPVTYPNAYSLGSFTPSGQLLTPPGGVFTSGTTLFIVDTGNSRIVRYSPAETWAAETTTAPSPQIAAVIGQSDLVSGKQNRGLRESDSTSFSFPTAAIMFGSELWVVDTGNNRVLSYPQSGAFGFPAASRVLGQFDFPFSSPNLVEGRELFLYSSSGSGGSLAVDRFSNPPRLYIADTFNNRILGFRDVRTVGTDARTVLKAGAADLVIGQPDLFHSGVNYPTPDAILPSDIGLNHPVGIAVDANGNLWVADTGNGRVLRFPSPFSVPAGSQQRANLVLGQRDFASLPIRDAGASNLNSPAGIAVTGNGSVAVSDFAHNRVVIYRKLGGSDFTNFQPAFAVLGQPDFTSSGAGSALGNLRSPVGLAVDSSDRLYVCDSGNNRMMVFTQIFTSGNGANATFQLGGLGLPLGVAVSQTTGDIFVTNANSNQITRLPEFLTLLLNPTQVKAQIPVISPLAVALDPFDNLIAAEAINRVSFYFAKLTYQHAASFNQQPLAPGQLAYLYRLGKPFDLPPADGTGQNPWPQTLADYQVFVNGIPAPIFRINKDRIDFQVPMSAPSSDFADFVLQKQSTGEIVAAGAFGMAASNPGFFTSNAQGFGQAAAVNEDGTINGPSNAIARGHIVSFYLTGQGVVPNAPPDGSPAPGPVPTPVQPVILSTAFAGAVPPQYVQYSGLTSFAGGWQINFQVPMEFPPGNNLIVVTLSDRPSNIGPTGNIAVTFAVK